MHLYARLALLGLLVVLLPAQSFAAGDFSSWLQGVRQEAARRGISQNVIQEALTNVEHNPRVIELDRKQPEKKLTFAQYKKNVISQARIDKGRALYRQYQGQLAKASKQYGVPPEIILALWGMETNYGQNTGGFDIVSALATLAYDGRRSEFFRGELFKALEILDQGHIRHKDMKGSWAGAMGQNQFMPSSFQAFAVDGDGNGRRDIWKSVPDVFASSANYLNKSGWRADEKWGRKVKLSQPVPESITGAKQQKSLVEWTRMGVKLPDGGALPTADGMYAALVLPDGPGGSAYLAYNNYQVILKWNRSTYFATSVGLLADLIRE